MNDTEQAHAPDAQDPKRRFIPHPKAERFDEVSVSTVERWKESELSGDEWRFSYVATFWRHGQPVAEIGGRSVADALLQAAARFNSVEVDGPCMGPYMGDLSRVCCQPGCGAPWNVLLHPVNRYDKFGHEMSRPYGPEDVRGFCAAHAHRGDCGLDDNDANYVIVEDHR